MTTPQDAELAWVISEWVSQGDTSDLADRANVVDLANYLSAQGFSKARKGLPSLTELQGMVTAAQSTLEDFVKGTREHTSATRNQSSGTGSGTS
jgi:uncharacterized protein YkwD